MPIRALIFDVDGTLSETEEVHRQAFIAFDSFGLGWNRGRDLYRALLKTTGGKERMAVFMREHLNEEPDPGPIEATMGCAAREEFEVITAGNEVARKKPAPDVFDLALAGLGLDPQHCLALDDSRNGLMSAKGAGLPCIVSPSAYTDDATFSEADAVVGCFSQVATLDALHTTLATKGN